MPVRESRDQNSFDSSPELIAVFHALQSLLTPRHPPCALNSLTASIQRSDFQARRCQSFRLHNTSSCDQRADHWLLFSNSLEHHRRQAHRRHHARAVTYYIASVPPQPYGQSLKTTTRPTQCAKSLGELKRRLRICAACSTKMPITTNPNCQRTARNSRPLVPAGPGMARTYCRRMDGGQIRHPQCRSLAAILLGTREAGLRPSHAGWATLALAIEKWVSLLTLRKLVKGCRQTFFVVIPSRCLSCRWAPPDGLRSERFSIIRIR